MDQVNNTAMMARDTTAKITQTITDFGFTRSTVKTSKLSFEQTQAMQKQIINDCFTESNNCLSKK